MKKVILSVFMLMVGLSSVAKAQAPCKTVKECEKLRDSINKRPKSIANVIRLNQNINQQIKDLPRLWPKQNRFNGVQWSGILRNQNGSNAVYANCISIKDKFGNPKLAKNGDVICEDKNKDKVYDGTLVDKGIITDSDAVRACKLVGGRLPTEPDFQALIDDWFETADSFRNEMQDKMFWSSSVGIFGSNTAHIRQGSLGLLFGGGDDRKYGALVRCIGS